MDYIILSLTKSDQDLPVFWRRDELGYTSNPFEAGKYSGSLVLGNQARFNNGHDTIAIPATHNGLSTIGFNCGFDLAKVKKLMVVCLQKLKPEALDDGANPEDDDFDDPMLYLEPPMYDY